MSFLFGPFCQLWRFRRILLSTSWVELKSSYVGSLLGVLWILLGPVILLVLYTVVYAVIFKMRPESLSTEEYVLYVLAGLVPFIAFSTSLTTGASALLKNRQILLNTVFPAELLPVRAVLVSSVVLPVGLVLIVIAGVALGRWGWTMALLPAVVILQVLFNCGIAWILSLLSLIVRDVQMVLQYVNMMLIIISPIGFPPEAIPEKLRLLMYLNPLYYYISGCQDLVIYGRIPSADIALGGTLLSLLTFCVGFWLFQRAKQVFYDYA